METVTEVLGVAWGMVQSGRSWPPRSAQLNTSEHLGTGREMHWLGGSSTGREGRPGHCGLLGFVKGRGLRKECRMRFLLEPQFLGLEDGAVASILDLLSGAYEIGIIP